MSNGHSQIAKDPIYTSKYLGTSIRQMVKKGSIVTKKYLLVL